jgi:hypothetical protein
VAAGVIVASILIVELTDMRPGYDAFGWMVWGKQVLHWNLNTDGAPSWKPLAFLFTLPYALAGHTQMWLWMVTAVAGALAGCVFAARIAFRLTGPAPDRPYAPFLAGAFAGVAVLGINDYAHQMLIANSDPLVVTLCLAAIDAHLSGRPRLAFAALVLASLGRPEAWVFTGLYAIWAWRAVPRMRLLSLAGLALIPALWFAIPALTSKSWFSAGDLALNTINAKNIIHGNKITGVISRFGTLYGLPMQLAAVAGIGLGLAAKSRQALALAAAAGLWIVIEIGFVLHGWSGAARYLFEPAAVMVVLAGSGFGRLIAFAPRGPVVLRWIGPVAAVGLLVWSYPTAHTSERLAATAVREGHGIAKQLTRLEAVIARDGGPRRIRACGQPVTLVGNQSAVAWEIGLNVGNVGFRPGVSIGRGIPVVVFKPHLLGWQVHPFNIPAADAGSCQNLQIDSTFG